MNRYRKERLGNLIYWLVMKAFKLAALLLVVAVVSSVVLDLYKDEISEEVWRAFSIQSKIDRERLKNQHGIIDDELINFYDERAEPKEI